MKTSEFQKILDVVRLWDMCSFLARLVKKQYALEDSEPVKCYLPEYSQRQIHHPHVLVWIWDRVTAGNNFMHLTSDVEEVD